MADDFEDDVPDYARKRREAAIAEARARGENPDDDGSGLAGELLVAFEEGRDRWGTPAALRERYFDAIDELRAGTITDAEVAVVKTRAAKWTARHKRAVRELRRR